MYTHRKHFVLMVSTPSFLLFFYIITITKPSYSFVFCVSDNQEYKKNYETPSSDFRRLIDLRDEHDGNIAETLLDTEKTNKRVFKKFLDVSMPACCKKTFASNIVLGEDLEKVVTVAEETFAILVLENNIDRWCHLAAEKEGDLPPLKYQKDIKKRKDNQHSAGDWTMDGMARFNAIAGMVAAKRKEHERKMLDIELKEMYIDDSRRNRKLLRSAESEAKKRKFIDINIFGGDDGSTIGTGSNNSTSDGSGARKRPVVVINLFDHP